MGSVEIYDAAGNEIQDDFNNGISIRLRGGGSSDTLVYMGELNGYNFAYYRTADNEVMILCGCRHFNLREALDHWKEVEQREEIYAACLYLQRMCEISKDFRMPEPVPSDHVISIKNLEELLEEIETSELLDLCDDNADIAQVLREKFRTMHQPASQISTAEEIFTKDKNKKHKDK